MGHLGIIEVDLQSADSIVINFSDGTYASFSADDLASLQPQRSIADGDTAEVGQDYL
jgi:hypothetical protein